MGIASYFSPRCLVVLLALVSHPGNGPAQEPPADVRLRLDLAFGRLQARDDTPDTALAEQEIWGLWARSGDAAQDVMLGQATAAMGLGAHEQAEAILDRLIALNPLHAEAWNKRATLYYLMGQFEKSLADIDKTLELEPRHFGALSGRGMILVRQGKPKAALRAYEEAAAINPHMPGVRAAILALRAQEPDL